MDVFTQQHIDQAQRTWAEESGLIAFLSRVPAEVERFEESFRMGLRYVPVPPKDIDGNEEIAQNTAFVVVRKNRLLPERDYCLYTVLDNKKLRVAYGIYRDGHILTVKEFDPLEEFSKAEAKLYNWLRELLRISCEKP